VYVLGKECDVGTKFNWLRIWGEVRIAIKLPVPQFLVMLVFLKAVLHCHASNRTLSYGAVSTGYLLKKDSAAWSK
jgi:hypothetical protein